MADETNTTATTSATSSKRKQRTTRTGTVASDKGDKTIVVVMDYNVKHPKYGKFIRRSVKAHAHDPKNEARVGDKVELMKCRNISKTKAWRLVRIVSKGVLS